jgi:putative protein kinase ArgK-like GTPase of G3E family
VVVHKADLPDAERTVSQIQAMLALSVGREVPVLPVSSKSGAGLPELVAALEALPARQRDGDDGERLLKLAQEALTERFRRVNVADIVAAWHGGLPTAEAVERVLRKLTGR